MLCPLTFCGAPSGSGKRVQSKITLLQGDAYMIKKKKKKGHRVHNSVKCGSSIDDP